MSQDTFGHPKASCWMYRIHVHHMICQNALCKTTFYHIIQFTQMLFFVDCFSTIDKVVEEKTKEQLVS